MREPVVLALFIAAVIILCASTLPGCTVERIVPCPDEKLRESPAWQADQCRKLCAPNTVRHFKARYSGDFECLCNVGAGK